MNINSLRNLLNYFECFLKIEYAWMSTEDSLNKFGCEKIFTYQK